MVLLIAFLLFSICILLIFAFHLWRRSAILEEALRSVSPATYTSLKTKSARSSPPLYALDVEYTAATPPPPYSLDPGIQTTESKPQRRSTVATHETSNYDYLDCDCYDGDSWASLPAEECRCLRAQKTMSL
ncbi:hypothetical protein EV356DRAFT_509988 [Viridothelium virens]|uniref:Uncharacterized protein n=1 Tax=Viridothelium virens TaxID=1048519 RepID=A0A6A6GX46_VIRVR|nr:hypothetical protein EV356DRAFT_509988 [Viridothelium virens]